MANEPIGILVDEEQSLRTFLNAQATKIPSGTDTSNWYYLPIWFNVTNDKIIAFNFSQLPVDLKLQIEANRDLIYPNKEENNG